jgi:hypothetical protein
VPPLSPESVWFARLNRALDALPLADPEKVRLVHEILVASATGDGSRGPTARVLWYELGAHAGVGACPWSPETDEPAAAA